MMKSAFISIVTLFFAFESIAQQSKCPSTLPEFTSSGHEILSLNSVSSVCYNGVPSIVSCVAEPLYSNEYLSKNIQVETVQFMAEKNASHYINGAAMERIQSKSSETTKLKMTSTNDFKLKPIFIELTTGSKIHVCAIYNATQNSQYQKCNWDDRVLSESSATGTSLNII